MENDQHRLTPDGVGQLAADHGTRYIEHRGKGHVHSRLEGGVAEAASEIERQKRIDEDPHRVDDGGEEEYVDGLGESAIDAQAQFHRTASMASASPSSLLLRVTAIA
ncbi:hypothetical protein DSECCO2_551870 [anaerobic digester metagenome]